jgi:hypothetical protein
MTRQRMSAEQALQAIRTELETRPDRKMTYRELLAALAAKGNDQAVDQFAYLVSTNALVSAIDAQVNGRPAMTVTLPTGG